MSPPPDQISDKHIEDAIGAAEVRLDLRPERNLGSILDVHTYDCDGLRHMRIGQLWV